MTVEYPFEDKYFDLDGLRYHYVDEGSGPVVLMVHGNPSWSFYFRKLILDLRVDHRVIAVDHIGCGRSDKPGEDRYTFTLSRRVADLERLVAALELRDVTLVVHDWGGMIGMAWAVRHVEQVKRLVIMNTAAFPLPATKRFPVELTLARLPGLGGVMVRGFNLFSRGANRFCVTVRPMPEEVQAAYLEPYDSWDHRLAVHRFVEDIPLRPSDPAWPVVADTAERLSAFAGHPMLIAWGMKDFVFDRHFLDEWVRRFPAAEVHRFEQAGHYVLEDMWEEIVPMVRGFVTKGPPAAQGDSLENPSI